MIYIFIGMHAQTHKLAYHDEPSAKAELEKLNAALSEDKYGKNRSEKPTHTVSCPTGDVVVVLEKVEMARVIDSDVDEQLHETESDAADDRDIARKLKYGAAMKAAGLLPARADG